MSSTKIEIMDTGAFDKGGVASLWRPTEEWINIFATTVRVEEDIIKSNHESRRFNGEVLYAPRNQMTSVMSQRLYINGLFPIEKLEDLKKFRLMTRTLGLKKIRGGMGLIESSLGATEQGELYVNILSIKPNEVLSNSTTTIGYRMHVEIIEED